MGEFDIQRGSIIIKGKNGDIYLPVLLDENGNIISVIQGSENIPIKQSLTGALTAEIYGDQNVAIAQEESGKLITVIQGDHGIIAQDINNNLISVMKGERDGLLKTVALDNDNAIKAVLYGDYDYEGNITSIGLSEQITRLEGLTSIDNKGHIIWYDTFEDTSLHWDENTDNAAHSIELEGTYTWHGNHALKFILGALASGVASEVDIIDLTLSGNYGLEVRFNHHPKLDLYFYLSLQDTISGLKYECSTGIWYCYNTSGSWTLIATHELPKIDANTMLPHLFNDLKLIINYSTSTYAYVLINGKKINLPNIKYYTTNGLGYASFIRIKAENTEAVVHDMWIDNVLLTKEISPPYIIITGIGFNNNKFNTCKFNSI